MSSTIAMLALVAGVVVVLATWQSIIVTIILPRRSRNWIALAGWIVTYRVVTAIARRMRGERARDDVLALLGPLNIVGLLFTWMVLFALGFALVIWSAGGTSGFDALDLAGSSIFTLGFAVGKTGVSHVLMDIAAASGMIVVGLQIGYLPTIYAAYSAREALVTLLNMRASEASVITGATILANHPLPASAALLAALFASWEASAAAIVESHTNYPWLIVFRSPRPSESWVTSMLAIVDAIVLLDAVAPSALPPEAEHCRFACTVTLRELATMLTPAPGARRSDAVLTREQFVLDVERLRDVVSIERDGDAAWHAFRAARQTYEADALALGAFLLMPNVGWLRPVEACPKRRDVMS